MITHPAPTAAQLERYLDALGEGVEADVARKEIWPDRARPSAILSLVHPEGHNEPIVVGWTTCGQCVQHLSNCKCPKGPVEPAYIAAWRPAPPRAEPTPVAPTMRERLRGEEPPRED